MCFQDGKQRDISGDGMRIRSKDDGKKGPYRAK